MHRYTYRSIIKTQATRKRDIYTKKIYVQVPIITLYLRGVNILDTLVARNKKKLELIYVKTIWRMTQGNMKVG